MENGQHRAQQLVRIIGSERQGHPPDVVAAAEKEIIRRLGGTRQQARRKVIHRGALLMLLGLLVAALAVVVAAQDRQAAPQACATALLAVLGLGIVLLGLLVLMRSAWLLRRARYFPVIPAGDIEALTAEPPLEELLQSIGPDRAGQSAEEVATAELELSRRLSDAREMMARRIRVWGWVAVGVGLSLGLMGMAWLVGAAALTLRGEAPTPSEGWFVFVAWTLLIWTVSMTCAATGWLVFAGGVGLRKRQAWGVRLIVATVRVAGAIMAPTFVVVFPAVLLEESAVAAVLIAWAFLATAPLWLASYQHPVDLLSRPEVQEACGIEAPPEQLTFAPRRRLSIRRAALLSLALAVFGPVLAWGIWWLTSSLALHRELAALRRSGAVIDFSAWKPLLPPQEENGAARFLRAWAQMHQAERRIEVARWPAPPMQGLDRFGSWRDLLMYDAWSPEQALYAANVLAEMRDALRSLREAVTAPHIGFDCEYSQATWQGETMAGAFRDPARLARLSALLHLHEHDYAGAIPDAVLQLRLSRFPDGDPLIIAHHVRQQCAGLAVESCEQILQARDLPGGALEEMERLLREAPEGLDLRRALECERASVIACWQEMIKPSSWHQFAHSRVKILLLRPAFVSATTAAIRAINAGVQLSARPPWEAMPKMVEFDRQSYEEWSGSAWAMVLQPVLEPANTNVLFFPHSLPVVAGVAESYARSDATVRSLRIAIALRRYKADNGQPAQALTELLPAYLPELPPDPFTGRDFLTKRADGMLTVYSVGEDLKDDGGKLEEDKWGHSPDLGVRIRE